MKNVKVVGMQIPCVDSKDTLRIDSYASLSDADLVVFCPEYSFNGSGSSMSILSFDIDDYLRHWEKEILSFLDHGGILVVVLTERRTYTLLGNSVNYLSNDSFYKILKIKVSDLQGRAVYTNKPIYAEVRDSLPENHMSFQLEITQYPPEAEVSFLDKRGDKVLGVTMKHSKGVIMAVPHVSFMSDFHYIEMYGAPFETGQRFIEALLKAGKILKKGSEKTPPPEWLKNNAFDLSLVNQTKTLITKNEATIANLEMENEALEIKLEAAKNLQGLLFETGKSLEAAVTEALTLLGYQAENYDDGELELDQVVTSPEGDRYIGECEGKDTKAINVSKFRQLKDSIAQDFELDHVEEQAGGLLIGNPQRLLPPEERTEDFTQKCKTGAKRDGTGLIKTMDLFYVARYLKEHNDVDFAKQCREAIKDQLGEVVKFPPIPTEG